MRNGRRTKLNNAGLSLVELIVVILIIAIVSGGAAISISILYNARVDNAAKRLQSMMKTARETAMAHVTMDTFLIVSEDDGDLYARVFIKMHGVDDADATLQAEEKLGNTNISLTFKSTTADKLGTGETTASQTVSDTSPIRIDYNAANGACKSYDDGGTDTFYTDVEVSGSETINIIIIPETGRAVRN